MKQLLLISGFAFFATSLIAQNNSTDETAIKNIIQQQEKLWNKHDWEAFSIYFAEDATLINFVGEYWNSSKDIIAHFKLLNDCCLEPTSLKFDCKNIKFLTRDIAIVYTEETLFADRDYEVPMRSYKKGDIDYKWRVDVFEKNEGKWKIKSTQMTLINQMLVPHKPSGKE